MKIRKFLNVNTCNYKNIELKLEKLASEGLMLEKFGIMFGIFRKDQPEKLKFTVSCFPKVPIFSPSITPDLQIFIDNAKLKGWTFITSCNQMQVFYTEDENSQPIEDERQKFDTIKKYMNKKFVVAYFFSALAFLLNIINYFNEMKTNPIEYLSNPVKICTQVSLFIVILMYIVEIVNYFVWYIKCKKSIINSGLCYNSNEKLYKIIICILMALLVTNLALMLGFLFLKTNGIMVVLIIMQVVFVYGLYISVIKFLKKKKVKATTNKIVSTMVLVVATFVYLFFILFTIIRNTSFREGRSDYRTVQWQTPDNETHKFVLYNDNIPLKCEDLYDGINYKNYSYRKDVDATIFITKTSYEQVPLPEKDAPPEIRYTIIEPKFEFVYNVAKEQLLEIPDYRDDMIFKPIDNNIFKTIDAYEYIYDKTQTGNYVLFYKDKIITLNLEKPATEKQALVILNKLK